MTFNLETLRREVESLESHRYFKTLKETLYYREAYESLMVHPNGDMLSREVIEDIKKFKQGTGNDTRR